MNQSVKTVQQQIQAHGGLQASEMLSRIFSESNQEFGKEFDMNHFFDDLWDRNKLPDEGWPREVEAKPNWDGNGTNNGYNVIPAINPNGICASFSLTIISGGFRNNGLNVISRRYGRLNFNKAILLLCDYWFACLRINKENLLITPDWDQIIFEKHYERVIESYTSNHNKKVFIVEVSKLGPILRYPY